MHGLRACLAIVIGLLTMMSGVGALYAQDFSLYNVVTDSFPRITANYIALDPAGQPYTDLTAGDLRVVETMPDGRTQDLTSTLTHTCVTTSTSSSVSLVLIVDESNSMDQVLPGGKKRLDFVKDALKLFVEKMPWNGQTSVSIIGFSGKSRLICDWQTSPEPVLEAIKRLVPLAATNYEVPFFGVPNVFDQMQNRSPEIPKVALFLTDGEPNPEIKDRWSFEQRAITLARAQGIRFYSATLMINRTDPSISRICQATGGRSVVANEASLVALMNALATETISRQVCKISWTSPMVCNDEDRARRATVAFRRGRQPSATVSYGTPPLSVHAIEAAPTLVVFGEVAPGSAKDTTIVVRTLNSDIRITNVTLSNTQFFQVVDFRPVSIRRGDSATFTVRFLQGAERITRQAVLSFTGTPSCLPTVALVGGGGTVVLTTPNGGEVVSTCTSTRIRWTGIKRDQPVRLDYTCDGISWFAIVDSTTGDWYDWQPPAGCATARVRVTTIAGERLMWARRLGWTGDEVATAIAVDPSGDRVYATGYFVGDTRIDTIPSKSALGRSDGYLAVFDAEGAMVNVHFLKGDVGANERIAGAVVDPDSNLIIAGSSASTAATFRGDSWSRTPLDEQVGFVAKYSKNGALLWRLTLAGNEREGAWVQVNTLKLKALSNGSYEINLVGYAQYALLCYNTFGSSLDEIDLPNDRLSTFTTRISPAGQPKSAAQPDQTNDPDPSMKVAEDASGYRYRTDDFTGTYIAPFTPPVAMTSEGQRDVWVIRTAIGVAVSDVSDKTFRILQPRLTTPLTNVVMDSTALGRSTTFSALIGLRNSGTTGLRIDSVVVSGQHPDDFAVIDDLDSVMLDTGTVRSIELRFTPTGLGRRTAVVTFYGSCDTRTSFTVSGEGRPECDWENKQAVDLGRHVVGSTIKQKIDCIILSQRRGNIRCSLAIKGSPDFQITPSGFVTLRSGECINVTVAYTPTTVGIQTAQIDINLPIECGIAFTQIQAEGVKPELGVRDVAMGNHRIATTASGQAPFINNGVVEVDITSMELLDTAGTGLKAVLPTLPARIAAGDTLLVPVAYRPWMRGSVLARLRASARGVDTSLVASITGAGYQPTLEAAGYTWAPVLVGTQSAEQGIVRLYNRDRAWPLTITDVVIGATSDFAWVAVLPSMPLTIPPGDSVNVPVHFTPAAVGTRSTVVRITHDGLSGVLPPYRVDSVLLEGVGLQRSVLPPVAMDTVLACLADTAYIAMMNDDPTTALPITGVRGSGDVATFTIDPAPPFAIPPSSTQRMRIVFTPAAAGRATASFAYDNPRNAELVINVTGVGATAPVGVSMPDAFVAEVGQEINVPIVLDVAPPATLGATTLSLRLQHHASAVRSQLAQRDVAPDWTFTLSYETNDAIRIEGQYSGALPMGSGPLLTIPFGTYLSAAAVSTMRVAIIDPPRCLLPSGDVATITVQPICYRDGRLISIGPGRYRLYPPHPNPVQGAMSIRYGVGLAVPARFDLVDLAGRVVRSWSIAHAIAGEYEQTVDLDGIASDVYRLHMISGPFTESVTILITQ